MKLILKTFLLVFLFHITSCSTSTKENKNLSCNLNDTIFKKAKYGMDKASFKTFMSNLDNQVLDLSGTKLICSYSPKYFNEKLYELDVELGLPDSLKKMMGSGSINHEWKNIDAYEKLLKIYTDKYGKNYTLEETGKKGAFEKEMHGAFYTEYGEFEIHASYVWTCNSKEIKIEYDLQTKLTDITWNSNQSEHEIILNKSFIKRYYENFKITYIDLAVEEMKYKDFGKKGMENLKKYDSINKIEEKKLKENI